MSRRYAVEIRKDRECDAGIANKPAGSQEKRKRGQFQNTDAMQEKSGSRITPFRMQKTPRNSSRFVEVELKGKQNTSGDAEEKRRAIQNASRYSEEEKSTIRNTSRYAEKERNAIRNTSRYAEKEQEKEGSQYWKNPKATVAMHRPTLCRKLEEM